MNRRPIVLRTALVVYGSPVLLVAGGWSVIEACLEPSHWNLLGTIVDVLWMPTLFAGLGAWEMSWVVGSAILMATYLVLPSEATAVASWLGTLAWCMAGVLGFWLANME